MKPAGPAALTEPIRLTAIFGLFLQIGALSFGGGITGWVHREVVIRRCWLDEGEFLSGLALGQILPGTNVVNLSLYVGRRLRGIMGALAAMLGLLIVPFFFVVALASIYSIIADHPAVENFLGGMAAAAVGLTLAVGLSAARKRLRDLGSLAVIAVILVTIGILRWPMVPIILVMIPISIALAWRSRPTRDA